MIHYDAPPYLGCLGEEVDKTAANCREGFHVLCSVRYAGEDVVTRLEEVGQSFDKPVTAVLHHQELLFNS